jgi:AcrR family transcriptional regulator
MSRGKARPYRQRRRAESAQRTRQRITEAAMRLHTSIGPSEASLRAIAKEAGVNRLTLSRHFASADELFGACMQHWTMLPRPPDPAPWLAIGDFGRRVRRALFDIYTWYDINGADLYPIHRDAVHTPAASRAALHAIDERLADLLLSGIPSRSATSRRRAAIVLAVGFWTWRSLTVDSGLSTRSAARLAADLVLAA